MGKSGQRDDPDKRRRFTTHAFIMASRTVYHKTLKVYKTAEDAIEKITPFRGHDPLRIHNRKTTFSRLIVRSGWFMVDIEYALRKKMFDLHDAVADRDPFSLIPTETKQWLTNILWLNILQIPDGTKR